MSEPQTRERTRGACWVAAAAAAREPPAASPARACPRALTSEFGFTASAPAIAQKLSRAEVRLRAAGPGRPFRPTARVQGLNTGSHSSLPGHQCAKRYISAPLHPGEPLSSLLEASPRTRLQTEEIFDIMPQLHPKHKPKLLRISPGTGQLSGL